MDMGSPVVTNVLLGILVLISIVRGVFQFVASQEIVDTIQRMSEKRFVS